MKTSTGGSTGRDPITGGAQHGESIAETDQHDVSANELPRVDRLERYPSVDNRQRASRDRAHIQLLERFVRVIGPRWQRSSEVPLPIPGDQRAWDRLLRGDGVVIGVQGETRPTAMQELRRRHALKKRDGAVDLLILVIPNSEWCRRLVPMNDLRSAFPVPGRVALEALAEVRDPGGDSIMLI
jgi:hypothetical protein